MSKLTHRQWANIERAVLRDGESMNAVAKRYKISESAVRQKLAKARTEQIEEVAIKLATAERDIKALPPVDRMRVRSLADRLVDLSYTMGEVAALGMDNALKLTRMKAQRIDDLMPGDSEGLREVVMLGEAVNKASKLGVDLMTVGKQSLAESEKDKSRERDVMTMAPINIPALKPS
jgi:hypothetical protein